MTNQEIKNQIKSYKKSISKLNEMKNIYDTEENLCGSFASDMYLEIDNQIKHCKECISNLEELITGKGNCFCGEELPFGDWICPECDANVNINKDGSKIIK